MEENHFEQAKFWLEGAKHTAGLASENRNKYNVAISMLTHSILKANDALTFKFMNITAKKHDDARRLFEDIIKRNMIKREYANYKEIIQEAINNKSKAEYRIAFFSKNDYDILLRKAEKFIKMAEDIIKTTSQKSASD